jgi:hypothetical protein
MLRKDKIARKEISHVNTRTPEDPNKEPSSFKVRFQCSVRDSSVVEHGRVRVPEHVPHREKYIPGNLVRSKSISLVEDENILS